MLSLQEKMLDCASCPTGSSIPLPATSAIRPPAVRLRSLGADSGHLPRADPTSNCTTFQARRLQIRERRDGSTRPVATLNGTMANTRWLVPILENHQQADGSVTVPEALRPYLGGMTAQGPEGPRY